MKRVVIISLTLLFILFCAGMVYSQAIVRLGDLPKSDYIISIYQVVGFQEGYEGYRLTYVDEQNELNYLFLPAEMRDKYEVYKPKLNTLGQNDKAIFKAIVDKGEFVLGTELGGLAPEIRAPGGE
jgi:hypothetical protein